MEDGYKSIELIKAGDMVYSANEETGEVSIKEVVRTFVNETDELIYLQMGDSELVTTPGHPFFIYGKGFEYAGNLRAGDILVDVNGEKVVLEFVQHEILETPVKVYNFEVEDWHTYFVGDGDIWTHNLCTTKPNASELGKQGEAYAAKDLGLQHNTSKIIINGRSRVPDFIDEANNVIAESKNVAELSYTKQLHDYVDKAKDMGTQLKLYVRHDTKLSGPLRTAVENNFIDLREFSW
jgi:intein/homing endonuclease